jgi:hypothetical protein
LKAVIAPILKGIIAKKDLNLELKPMMVSPGVDSFSQHFSDLPEYDQ